MTTRVEVDEFLSEKTLALAGVSRGGKKFGNSVLKELTAKGFTVYPVHPKANEIDQHQCYPSLSKLPGQVGGLIVVLQPEETQKIVREAKEMGIKKIWMQQGSESNEAIAYCNEHGLSVIHGECILMFAEPAGAMHRFHRWIWKILGKLPEETA
jgi:uncharacterized protein